MRNLSPEKKALLFLALVVLCSIVARALKARESAVSVQAGALDLESFARQTDSAVQQGRRKAPKPKVSKRAPPPRPISLGSATAGQLARLPGVTPTMAERIIAARDRKGGRFSLDDLAAVQGVGRRKAEAIQPYLRDLYVSRPLIGYEPPTAEQGRSPPGRSGAGKASVGPVNVNRATREELETLPGIGPSLAERILAEREKRGRFQNLAALDSVPGIGPALLKRLAPMVRF